MHLYPKATNFCVRFIYVNYVHESSAGRIHVNLYVPHKFYRAMHVRYYALSARTHIK